MDYSEFKTLAAYREKVSGAHIDFVLVNAADATDVLIGAATGVNVSEDREAIPIEEMGDLVVSEVVQGRNSITYSVTAMWTPEWNDKVPSTGTLGGTYIGYERMADGRPGEGTILNVYLGSVIRSVAQSVAGRGSKTFDLSFVSTKRLTGQQWADLVNAAGA